MAKILYIFNTAAIGARFRKPVIQAALTAGYQVNVLCGRGINASTYIEELTVLGAAVQTLSGLEDDGMSVSQLFDQSKEADRIINEVQPNIVHAFTHRANVTAYLALRRHSDVRFIPNVTGAGRLFDSNLSLRDRLVRQILLRLYRAMGQRCECIFFQNEDDLNEIGRFMRLPSSKLRLTSGSGFDPTEMGLHTVANVSAFRAGLERDLGIAADKRLYLFPARALRNKGVAEFYEAATCYLDLFDDAVFVHAGEVSSGPHGMNESQLKSLQRPGLHFVGFRNDIFSFVQSAFAVVLPSSYREGVPRSLIEALCYGKVILTTDSPGCRETVIDGWNGKLFRPQSTQALLTALVASRELDAATAAQNSRKLFLSRFHANSVAQTYLDQYNLSEHARKLN